MRAAGAGAILLLLVMGVALADQFILPPSLPEEGKPTITLAVVDAQTKEAIANASVIVLVRESGGNESKTIALTNGEGKLALAVEKGSLRLVLYIDNFNTSGSDYVSREFAIDPEKSPSGVVEMFPSGSLKGEVYDASGMRVEGSEVKLSCGGDYGEQGAMSDRFGSFSARYLPVGECSVSAMSSGMVGEQRARIEQGKVASVKVELKERLAGQGNNLLLLGGAVLVLALVAGAALLARRQKRKREHEEERADKDSGQGRAYSHIKEHLHLAKEEHGKPAHHPRMHDVMKTLDEKGKLVVEFLLKEGGKARQSKVYYGTRIPKTSLFRVLRSLEKKNVIKASKFENLKEIELTGWFLGKEA